MAKRERAGGDDGEEYTLPAVKFDEAAFMRREIESARATFVAVGVGILAGILARLVQLGGDWKLGWIPILVGVVALRPLFVRVGFSENQREWKSLLGTGSMVFFTGLTVWILAHNVPF